MKILVNATSCNIGGSIQAAVSFILNSLEASAEHEYEYIVSTIVFNTLINIRPELQDILNVTELRPSQIIKGRKSRKFILELEVKFKPDVVFTVFGPAYVRFSSPHVVGFARGWLTHPNKYALGCLSFKTNIIRHLTAFKEKLFLNKNYYYIEETEVGKKGMVQHTQIPADQIIVIPNTFAAIFGKPSRKAFEDVGTVKILLLTSYYRHKNIEILPSVALALQKLLPEIKFEFVMTLDKKHPAVKRIQAQMQEFKLESMWSNRGPVTLADCPKLYSECDVAFIPTLLETFSAAYPEAMKMERPLVTTDLDFAHDICQDAALYYSPLSGEEAARAIVQLATDSAMQGRLINNGLKRVDQLPCASEKFTKQLEALKYAAQKG